MSPEPLSSSISNSFKPPDQKKFLGTITELVAGLDYPEAPYWSGRDACLYFVEWTGNRISCLKNGGVTAVFETGTGSGPCGVRQDSQGNFWVCLYSACQLIKYNPDGIPLVVYDQFEGQKFKGPNDLCLDLTGGVYFTDSGNMTDHWISGNPAGSVFYLNKHGDLHLAATGICYPNGIVLSRDEKWLYVNEHRRNRVLSYKILGMGELSEPQVLIQLDDECSLEPEYAYELGPDGMCMDNEGNLWVAHFGGGKIIVINPGGRIKTKIPLPRGRRPTNLSYRADTNTFYITEAELGMLYQIEMGH